MLHIKRFTEDQICYAWDSCSHNHDFA